MKKGGLLVWALIALMAAGGLTLASCGMECSRGCGLMRGGCADGCVGGIPSGKRSCAKTCTPIQR